MQNNLPSNNSDLNKILYLLNQGENVFLTGVAGTGKSYILKWLKKYYRDYLTITSTTGISAVNINGQTIHSWAEVGCMERQVDELAEILENTNFGPIGRAKRRIQNCTLLAIDEISMLSAYELEYLDKVFQAIRGNKLPFGGIQVIFIGDFLQLPPVATESDLQNSPRRALFCFQSSVWDSLNLKNVVLTKIYRQNNSEFTKMLCNFRLGAVTDADMQLLSRRFVDDSCRLSNKLHLFPKKLQAQRFNKMKLNELSTPIFEYRAYDDVPVPEDITDELEKSIYKRKIFSELNKNCQAEWDIKLRVGCRVMLLKNMDFNTGLINGSCGVVVELAKSFAVVKFDNGITKKIGKCLFELQQNDIVIAKRFQLPLKLAYAITIHKSQGMTFDEVVIDCASSFSPGQVYVGLSRVKTIDGLFITGFNPKKIYPSHKARYFYFKLEDEERDKVKDELFKKYS